MPSSHRKDPLEERVEKALERNGVLYERHDHVNGIDFYLPMLMIYVEVKAMHTPRVSDQMARVDHIIVLQGHSAVNAFCGLLDFGAYHAR